MWYIIRAGESGDMVWLYKGASVEEVEERWGELNDADNSLAGTIVIEPLEGNLGAKLDGLGIDCFVLLEDEGDDS